MSKGNQGDFLKALFTKESGGNYKVINYAGYIGKYQFGESALIDLGYYVADGTSANDWSGKWTNKHGIDSLEKFRNDEATQDVAAREWIALLCKRSKKYGLDAYIGKTIKGIKITHSGIIAGAHLKGFGSAKHPGVKQFLVTEGKTDPADGLGTTVSHYVELFGDYELDCCNRVSVAFAEKQTGAPIAGMRVHFKKNGKIHDTAVTDGNGLINAIHGFGLGDSIEILVEKISGGFKSLKTVEMQDMNLLLAFVSPKSKAIVNTDTHRGKENPNAAAEMNKQIELARHSKPESKLEDQLDIMQKIWTRLVPHESPIAESTSKSESTTTKQSTRSSKTEKARSASGHPVDKITKSAKLADKRPEAPMKKTIPGLLFPLEKKPKESYKEGARAFATIRDHGRRRHAGIDLYAPVGTPIRAMADGVVLRVYGFYADTWAIEIDHGNFIGRYGEVNKRGILVTNKEKVSRGQQIGEVGKLKGLNISMLHLEMYGTTENPNHNDLTQRTKPPFQRREDLIDPTTSIEQAVME